MATGNKQNVRWNARNTLVMIVLPILLGSSSVDSLHSMGNEPCTLWSDSYYWRGVCWKILPTQVELRILVKTDQCKADHPDANQGIPNDEATFQFLSTLTQSGEDPIVWTVGRNGSTTLDGRIDLVTLTVDMLSMENCTGLNISTGLEEGISCPGTYRVSCFFEVGNPCTTSATETGDLLGSSCYYFNSHEVSWEVAKVDCQSRGHYLVEILDNQEQQFITGMIPLLNMTKQVLVGAQRNASHVNSDFVWTVNGSVVEGVFAGNDSCMAMLTNGTFTPVSCDATSNHYICQKAAPNRQYFIAIPEAIQTASTQNEAYITLMTSSLAVSAVIDIYVNGSLISSTSLLLRRHTPLKYHINNTDDLLLKDINFYRRAIHVTTYGESEVSLIYMTSSTDGGTPTSADVTIFPSLFLDTYYVITTIRTNHYEDETIPRMSFISVLAIDGTNTTTVNIYFARRYRDITLNYFNFELINPGKLYFELQKYESVMIDGDGDLTGTTVKADKPVAVFSGNKITRLTDVCCPNYAMTHVIPFKHVTNEYLVLVPSKVYYNDVLYRITATEEYTNVYIYDENVAEDGNYIESFYFRKVGTSRDLKFSSGSFLSLRSSSPFILSSAGPYGSTDSLESHYPKQPCLMAIPPIHLYRNHYVFNPKILLDSWSDLWLSIIGKNINITNSDTISINTQSIQAFMVYNNTDHTIYGEDNNRSAKAIVMEITDRDKEFVFDSTDRNSSFFIILNWRNAQGSFCRVLGIDVEGIPDPNANYTVTPQFEAQASVYRSGIMFGQESTPTWVWYSGSSSSSSSSNTDNQPIMNTTATGSNVTTDVVTYPTTPESTVESDSTTQAQCLAIPQYHNLSEGEVQNLIKDIQKRLFVNPKDVSAYLRKYTSISDPRPSSTTMGIFGIMTFTLMIFSILLSDIISFSLFVVKWVKIFKHKYYDNA